MNFLFNLLEAAEGGETSPTTNNGAGNWIVWVGLLVVIVIMFVVNYFSRKKQQKAAEEKMSAIKAGDKIKTIGLICGTVVSVDDVQNTLLIQTGEGDKVGYITIDKNAVYQTFPEGSGVNGVSEITDEPFEAKEETEAEQAEEVETAEEVSGEVSEEITEEVSEENAAEETVEE